MNENQACVLNLLSTYQTTINRMLNLFDILANPIEKTDPNPPKNRQESTLNGPGEVIGQKMDKDMPPSSETLVDEMDLI